MNSKPKLVKRQTLTQTDQKLILIEPRFHGLLLGKNLKFNIFYG